MPAAVSFHVFTTEQVKGILFACAQFLFVGVAVWVTISFMVAVARCVLADINSVLEYEALTAVKSLALQTAVALVPSTGPSFVAAPLAFLGMAYQARARILG